MDASNLSSIGKKYDQGKPRFELLPLRAVRSVVDVLTFGAKTYGDENWTRLDRFDDRYYAAAMRHLTAAKLGERIDPASGLPHLAHAVCSLLFMLAKEVGFDEGFRREPAPGSVEPLVPRRNCVPVSEATGQSSRPVVHPSTVPAVQGAPSGKQNRHVVAKKR